jgi:hypothetical protein
MRNPYVLACGIAATPGVAHGPTVGAWGDFQMYMYEFVGDLSKFDDPGLVDEDGEVVHPGCRATELLTRALLGYHSLSPEDLLEVENLLKHIFDPCGTVFCGRPFMCSWASSTPGSTKLGFCKNNKRRIISTSGGPMLVFSRAASGAADEARYTKLILKFRNMAENDRSLVVLCSTYETLAQQADVRVT